MSHIFAIIGAGLTGTAMLYQFVKRLQQRTRHDRAAAPKIKIMVFERQDSFGPGFPHGERYVMPFHITNMCGHDMGIIAGKPDDFQQWVNANRNILRKYTHRVDAEISRNNTAADRCRHYPRAVMGEYLKARFRDSLDHAQALGVGVELHPEVEITDLRPNGHQSIICGRRIPTGRTFCKPADRVLLATGHWFEQPFHARYFTSPWPARDLLRQIPAGEQVGVVGASLSAIETVLTLTSDGKFRRDDPDKLHFRPAANPRKIALYSRRGLLPKVRGRSGPYRNQYLTRQNLDRQQRNAGGRMTLEQIFELLNADLASAYGRPVNWEEVINPRGSPADQLRRSLEQAREGDGPHGELIWQTVLHQSFPLAREVFLSLAPAERERFERDFATLFFMHAATQPSINAEKMLALLDCGIIRVHKLGEDYQFVRDEDQDCFEFRYRDHTGVQRRDAYRYIVNARGQEKFLKTNPSELAQNLLRMRWTRSGEIPGNGLIDRTGSMAGKDPGPESAVNRTANIRIDPVSHRISPIGSNGEVVPSPVIYAVGAMTRSQILDASMAYGIARSTAAIADDWVGGLKLPTTRR